MPARPARSPFLAYYGGGLPSQTEHTVFLGGGQLRGDAFDPMTLLTAFIGAVILLAIVNLVRRGRVR